MTERINVKLQDNERNNLFDKLGSSSGNQLKGRFRIFERKVGDSKLYLVEDTTNLIVYHGRNWLIQRAFNTDLTARPNWKSNYISWFALGSGGAVVGDPLTPAAPDLTDVTLDTHVALGGSGGNVITHQTLDYHTFDPGYPRLIHDGTVSSDPDIDLSCTETDPGDALTYPCDSFLIAESKVTIAADEGNGGGSQNINECGLFVSPSHLVGDAPGFGATDIQMFARVTFSTIVKDSSRELIFSWYVYF